MTLAPPPPPPLLEVDDLTVEIWTPNGVIRAADGLSYRLGHGEILGVVGESGSGKTVSALALLGLLPRPNARVVRGRVALDGRDLLALRRRELRAVRGKEISIIFQDPLTALNPVFTIERQLMDAIGAHTSMPRRHARDRANELLETVGVTNGVLRAGQYPYQWSGGMRQRALIAMALANHPRLIVADEPTTALDVTIQAQVFETLKTVQRDTGAAMILISHDLAQVAEIADRVIVMYAGRIVEDGPTDEVLAVPKHPYTQGLLDSVPRMSSEHPLVEPIPGNPPNMIEVSMGCAFEPRCALSGGRRACREERPALVQSSSDQHVSACHFHDESTAASSSHSSPVWAVVAAPRPGADDRRGRGKVALRAANLRKDFVLPRVRLRSPEVVRAVDDVSLTLERGTTLGLVGESGCGKSTLAWMLAGLIKPDSGAIEVGGVDITTHNRDQMRAVRRNLQIVFQDPLASLDPRMLVDDILLEPLAIHHVGTATARRLRVAELLDLVGLDQKHGERYPHELSGGQRQRVAIARALALETEILILDEPVSALDVSIQAQIIRLVL